MSKWLDRLVYCFTWPFVDFTTVCPKPRESDANSVFRKMLDGRIPVETILKNDSVWSFRDINPGAEVHLLVIPTEHIRSVHSMNNTEQDISLLRRMKEVGIESLKAVDAPGNPDEWTFGFHVPPMNSVDHLHLHCLAGSFNRMGKLKYQISSHFLPVDTLIDKLVAEQQNLVAT